MLDSIFVEIKDVRKTRRRHVKELLKAEEQVRKAEKKVKYDENDFKELMKKLEHKHKMDTNLNMRN